MGTFINEPRHTVASCLACAFWVPPVATDHDQRGQCRRMPPAGGFFPETPGDCWCGEFRSTEQRDTLAELLGRGGA